MGFTDVDLIKSKLSDGHPRAEVVVYRLLSHPRQDVNDDNLRLFMKLYSLGIIGMRLYNLYSYGCNHMAWKFRIAMQEIDTGLVDLNVLIQALNSNDSKTIKALFDKGEDIQ
jgi:hypothetical protein